MAEDFYSYLKGFGFHDSKETQYLVDAFSESTPDESALVSDANHLKSTLNTSYIGHYWVATALATGALQWLGGRAMQGIFGSGSSDGQNIGLMIQETIRQMSSIIQVRIEENALREYRARVEAAQNTFQDFLRAPTDALLENATIEATKAVALLRSLGIVGQSAYMGAVSLRLLILQERANRFQPNRDGELQNIVAQIEQGREHHNTMLPYWRQWNLSLYIKETVCRGNFCGLWVYKRGVVIFKTGNLGGAKRDKFIQDHSELTYKTEVVPTHITPVS